eukprot:2764082-Prymnesium_polylepis.2
MNPTDPRIPTDRWTWSASCRLVRKARSAARSMLAARRAQAAAVRGGCDCDGAHLSTSLSPSLLRS